MDDKAVEQEIQDKGLTAPRVTPDRIEELIVDEQYHIFPGTTFTSCILTLENGFTVHGESACASPENFDAEIGGKIARENAKSKIWALEGYALKQKLHEASKPADFMGRLLKEQEELADKVTKLGEFIGAGQPNFIDVEQWALLNHQYEHMVKYHTVLAKRIGLLRPSAEK